MNPGVNARHPRYGRDGVQVYADVNAFGLTWKDSSVVVHYDGMKPTFTGPGGRQITLGSEKRSEIIQRIQTEMHPNLFPKPGAYDGRSNLYAFRPFSFTSQAFEVPWERNAPPPQQSRPGKTVEVTIVQVRTVDISLLHRLLTGAEQDNPSAIGSGTNVASALNMIQVFLQATPRMAEGNLVKGKSIFAQWRRGFEQKGFQRKIDDNLNPLKLLDGLFQSVRPTINRLLVNIDLSVGVVIPPMALAKLCGAYLRVRDLRDLRNLDNRQFDRLKHFVRDIKITIAIRGQSSKSRARRIRGLVRDVGSQTFDRDGGRTTVRDHFSEVHRIDIPPGSLGIIVGQHAMYPISECDVPQQLYRSKLQPEHVREVLSFVPQNPAQRLQRIQAGWQNLQYERSTFLAGARISIDPKPLTVEGRLLTSPKILYGPQDRPENVSPPKPGTWDVMRRTFWNPATLPYVLILNLTGRPSSGDMEKFMGILFNNMRGRGMRVKSTSPIVDHSGADIERFLPRKAQELGAPKSLLLIALLPENAAELYAAVKRAGDVVHGIPTQCVRWSSKLVQNVQSNRGIDQYANNLILKINARCGGINHVPLSKAMEYLASAPAMVVGADVSHPSPGSKAPSFASLVSSRDQHCALYAGQINMQTSRLEMIESLPQMMMTAINTFRSQNNDEADPNMRLRRIFFFRDGVSEGEFETVRVQELGQIKKLLEEIYGPHRPKITFIVVGKRHHFRFFPRDRADGSGNCPSGFVVDRGIEHPVYSDFYLQSQPGLKGTSIPAHYTVIEDENLGGDGDKLQAVAYALCHSYQRSTRSVKIPAPVYYADLVCRRAKFHFLPQYSNQLEGLSEAGSDEQPGRGDFRELHADLRATMHFM